ncbi:hypothetical protein CDD83_9706 [Cordyceps sp. RAO-2017]|nr:hypothetical protein CDD83_9706 [Cordyceps sp. RAO-2017]
MRACCLLAQGQRKTRTGDEAISPARGGSILHVNHGYLSVAPHFAPSVRYAVVTWLVSLLASLPVPPRSQRGRVRVIPAPSSIVIAPAQIQGRPPSRAIGLVPRARALCRQGGPATAARPPRRHARGFPRRAVDAGWPRPWPGPAPLRPRRGCPWPVPADTLGFSSSCVVAGLRFRLWT